MLSLAARQMIDQSSHAAAQLLAAAVVVTAFTLLAWATTGGVRGPFLGADKRLSTSKTTALLWTLFVAFAFTTELIVALRVNGSALTNLQNQLKPMPSNTYLLLLGGPFAALVAAKGIVVNRLANGTLQKTEGDSKIHVGDLVSDDKGQTDVADLQFAVFNVVAFVFALGLFMKHPLAGLPPIPDGLAALTSLSALAYVGNKAVSQNAPLIRSLLPSAARPGELVTLVGSNLLPPHDGNDKANLANPVVQVGNRAAEVLGSVTSGQLQFRVPEGVPPGQATDVTVTTSGDSVAQTSATLLVEADDITLSSVVPDRARPGGAVTLLGRHFLDPRSDDSSIAISPVVVVAGAAATVTGTPSDDKLTVLVPALPPRAAPEVQISVRRGSKVSTAGALHVIAVPVITTVEPQTFPAGAPLTAHVRGEGFPEGAATDLRQVTLDGTALLGVTWQGTSLVIPIPAGILTKAPGNTYTLVVMDETGQQAAKDVPAT